MTRFNLCMTFANQKWIILIIAMLLGLTLAACDDSATTPTSGAAKPNSTPANQPPASLPTPSVNARIGYAETDPVARVDGVAISADDFDKAIDEARATTEEGDSTTLDWTTADNKENLKALREQSLEGLINYQVVAAQAAREGVVAAPDAIQTQLDDFKKQLGSDNNYKTWLARRFLSESDYKKRVAQAIIFDQMSERHSPVEDKGEQVHVRHILVSTEPEARDLYARLQQGSDFAALAKQFSLDVESAPKGGDLDWIFRGQTDPAFEQAAFNLAPNTFSGPVKTDKGYHLIQSLGKEVRPLPFDLVQQRKQEAFSAYIKTLRDKAKIEKLMVL